jgi:hypothetical protein
MGPINLIRIAHLTAFAALALVLPATAAASSTVPLTISESLVFPPFQPPVGTFTLSGVAGCASGTFGDELLGADATFTHVRVARHYVCGGGAGIFTAVLALTVGPGPTAGTASVSGLWTLREGTGELAHVRAAGRIQGLNVGCVPFAGCAAGSGTVVGAAHLA